jgi:predicted transcriptional regulator
MIKDLPLYDAYTCTTSTSIADIARMMKEKKTRHLYVLSHDKPVGIISATDIVEKAVALENLSLCAQDVMNQPVDYVEDDKEVEYAMSVMLKRGTYACLVTHKGSVKGVVDYKSVVERVIKKLEEEEAA